jgi:hypothetical protein
MAALHTGNTWLRRRRYTTMLQLRVLLSLRHQSCAVGASLHPFTGQREQRDQVQAVCLGGAIEVAMQFMAGKALDTRR